MSAFLNVPVQRGATTYTRVAVGEFSDGTPVTMPVVTIGGVKDGPTLYVQAGIHGDELTCIEVCRRAVATVDPKAVAGTVVAVPVANIPSHLTRTRGFLHEERWLIDMNRYWPGKEDGLLTERLAHILFQQFVCAADFTIDLHSALDGCDILPFVYVWPADDANGTLAKRERMATAFGAPYIYYHDRASRFGTSEVSRSLAIQADLKGAPVMLAESGESRRVSEEFVPIGVRGIRNVMIEMGMLDGEPDRPSPSRVFTHFDVLHAAKGGGLRLKVSLGEEVTGGLPIAEIVDVFGRTVEEVVSPQSGFVLRVMRLGSVSTGAEIAWIGHGGRDEDA